MTKSAWFERYKAAVFETDREKASRLIAEAEYAIHERQHTLSVGHQGSLAERDALANALSGLQALRKVVRQSKVRQN